MTQQATLAALGEQRVAAIAHRYADAMERGDVDTIISMLTRDASWSMPPYPTWFQGHEAVRAFLVSGPQREIWRHATTRANGQLAVGGYLFDRGKETFEPWVIDVLTFEGEKISAVTAFLAAEDVEDAEDAKDAENPETADPPRSPSRLTGAALFTRFALPAVCPEP